MTLPLNAGVIGLGVGARHAEVYRHHKGTRVAALCDLDPAVLAETGQRHPCARLTRDAEDVLADPGIDLVSIASWDQHHHAQVVRAIEAGMHIFVEKPLTLSRDEAADIHDRLRLRPDVLLSSNLVLRRCPRFRRLKRMIADGRFGRLYYLEADYDYGRIHKLIDGWRGQVPGYSLVLGGGVHMVDLVTWLADERVVEVSAMGNRIATEAAGADFDNFDFVVATLKFAGGAVAKVTCNGGCVRPHYHGLEIYGTEATFINRSETGLIYDSRTPGAAPGQITEAYPGRDKGSLLSAFIDAVIEDAKPEVDADHVFESLAVCFAIEQAVHAGRTVAVDYF